MYTLSRTLGSLSLLIGALGIGCVERQNATEAASIVTPSGGNGPLNPGASNTNGAVGGAGNTTAGSPQANIGESSGGSTPDNRPSGLGGSATPSNDSASTGGTVSTGGSSAAPKPCLDTPRNSESCENAKQWGFCGQGWFAGNCEITCGVCAPSTSGSSSSTGSSSTGTSSPGDNGSSSSGANGVSTATGGRSSISGSANAGTSTGSAGGASSAANAGTGGLRATSIPPRVDNPYEGVTGYINPEWKANADAEPGGSRVSNNPTGVWMDRIAAIKGTGSSSSMGMRDHLDAALAQKAGYIQFVIYDLPGRDCAALSSNGELGPADIDRYKKEYIDPIAAIESDAKYVDLRIINIIEIDSLPNLVTNTGSKATATPTCDVMKANGNYQKGIQYALGELYKAGNTYNYIDAGHHGWIGWDDNFNDSTQLFYQTASGAEGGVATVTGFITNTANYSALEEPYLKITESNRESKWISFNKFVDELSFAKAMRTRLISLGFSSNIGMIIDTSRNGWGGPKRPSAASTATDVNTAVDESRVDKRLNTGNWCNQSGAGLGERPRAINADGIDAYVWIKPPGESDGASQAVANDQGKGFDGMCDPTYTGNPRNENNMSGALGNAPLSGAWFSAQFQELMNNAYPPL